MVGRAKRWSWSAPFFDLFIVVDLAQFHRGYKQMIRNEFVDIAKEFAGTVRVGWLYCTNPLSNHAFCNSLDFKVSPTILLYVRGSREAVRIEGVSDRAEISTWVKENIGLLRRRATVTAPTPIPTPIPTPVVEPVAPPTLAPVLQAPPASHAPPAAAPVEAEPAPATPVVAEPAPVEAAPAVPAPEPVVTEKAPASDAAPTAAPTPEDLSNLSFSERRKRKRQMEAEAAANGPPLGLPSL